jgi:hypothetical protein
MTNQTEHKGVYCPIHKTEQKAVSRSNCRLTFRNGAIEFIVPLACGHMVSTLTGLVEESR